MPAGARDAGAVEDWFAGYLDAFAACARGEEDGLDRLVGHYAVPLLLTSPQGVLQLASEAEVREAAGAQAEALRAAGYERSEVLEVRAEPLNPVTVLVRGRFARRRAGGGELGRVEATYLVTDGRAGRRIAALVVHGS